MAIVAAAGILAVAFMLTAIMPELPANLVGQARAAIVLVGLSLALNLPTTVFAAVVRKPTCPPAFRAAAGCC